MDVKRQLGERVRFLRESNGWSQMELGLRAGIERSYISRIETGETNPQLDTLELLAQGFNVGLDQLMKGILTTKEQHHKP